MDGLYPNQVIKKTAKDTLKLNEKREKRVREAVYTFIQDNNVQIVSDDQIYYNGRDQSILTFAEILKGILETENKNKAYPIESPERYVETLRELNAERHRSLELSATNLHSKLKTEAEIIALTQSEKLNFSKSLEQAEEFLQHILFRVPEGNGAIKVIVKREYQPKGLDSQQYRIQKEIMLPGYKTLRDYEETLKNFQVKGGNPNDKPKTYWDVFSNSKAVLQASMVYNPHMELYWCDDYKHYYVNDYIEPKWKKQPEYFHLLERHKYDPMSITKLSNLLRSYLMHLFPDPKVRNEVLKWCAFSNTDKLQTYLTLIGPQGIGKGILVESFLAYYHGDDNFNKPSKIIERFNEKNAKSTLLYFDELTMTTLSEYNEMKRCINPTLSYEDKCKSSHMGTNFANVVWSCNTRDTMSALSRDDRRFKIVPVTQNILQGAQIVDVEGKHVGVFTSSLLRVFATDEAIKKEFVLLMLSIRDHVEANQESKDDINSISDNETRDKIYIESRDMRFTEIIDTLRIVYNNYNEITGRFNKSPNPEEREGLGEEYRDYVLLGKLVVSSDSDYTYRVPFSVVRKVIETRGGRDPLKFRAFNRNLESMPPSSLRGINCGGQCRDIEIRLEPEQHKYFKEVLEPLVLQSRYGKLARIEKPEEKAPEDEKIEDTKFNPFGD